MRLPNFSHPGPLDFLRGFILPFRAIVLVFTTPRLALLTLAVSLVTVCCLVGLVVLLWYCAPGLVQLVWPPVWSAPQKDISVWLEMLAILDRVVMFAVVVLVYLLLFVIGATTLPMMLAAPLMDPISEETERFMGITLANKNGPGFFQGLVKALANSLLHILALASGHLLLLILLLIPVIGMPLWTVFSWCWTIIWAAAAYLDIPMARHSYTFRHELRVLRSRFGLCLGFGAAISIILAIPLLNCIFVPVSVVGATLLFHGLESSKVGVSPGESVLVT